jgi:hypothetical protein
MLAIPRIYSKEFVMRWMLLEMMAIRFSNPNSIRVKAQADSQVPKPPIPLIGRAELISAPVTPNMVLEKLRSASKNS